MTHFDLFNPFTGVDLGRLYDGMTVSLSRLHAPRLDVAAYSYPQAASTTFSLNGRYVGFASGFRLTLLGAEHAPPAAGLSVGTYTLIVQPFSGKYANGLRGGFRAVHFRVVK